MEEVLPYFLVKIDYKLWFYLNVEWRTPLLDTIMPFIRNQFFWAPVYLFLLAFTLINLKKEGIFWCMAFIITFGLCDSICAGLLKPIFARVRPCNNVYLQHIAYLIVPRSYGLSFPSNHATNHFGLSVFIALTLGEKHRWVWIPALLWALAVSYAQVYVGVHFPLDVICGGILGCMLGALVASIFKKIKPVLLSIAPGTRKYYQRT